MALASAFRWPEPLSGAFLLDLDQGVRAHQGAIGALDGDLVSSDLHIHALRDGDRHLSNAGHLLDSFR
jgi:hypothetical protein